MIAALHALAKNNEGSWTCIASLLNVLLNLQWFTKFCSDLQSFHNRRENEKLSENENVRLEFSSKKFEARNLLNSNASVPENGCCFSNSYFDN